MKKHKIITFSVYNHVLEKYTEQYDFSELIRNLDFITNIQNNIKNGIPVLKSMEYKEDGDSGHVIVVVGYIDNCFIINDPYCT